jgi:GntR family transcriptional regulator, transcriptional repressor for pyruvate dehydrogenase complex
VSDTASTWDPDAPEAAEPPSRPRRALLGTVVADRIKERILERALAPGTPLPSEASLAEEFDVSLRVVRDALRALTNQGIVETRQGKRAVVGTLRPVAVGEYFQFVVSSADDAIGELLDLRLALETQAARAAAKRATTEELVGIRRMFEALVAAGDDLEQRAPADVAFHRAIAEASGNRFFVGILDALADVFEDERRRGGQLPGSHEETNAQHEALVAALEARNAELAEERTRLILLRAREYFDAPQPSQPDAKRRRLSFRRQ